MSRAVIDAETLWHDIENVWKRSPLVHNITNEVVTAYNANVLLAIGASPVMAHTPEEVAEMAARSDALVLNMGTLGEERVKAMVIAMQAARAAGKPVVLDPVAAGATAYRKEMAQYLLSEGPPHVIRGNASEILTVAGIAAESKGVDSVAEPETALDAAEAIAKRVKGTVCISGERDYILDSHGRRACIANGHEWMTRVTGTGCAATAMCAAFCAVQPDTWQATLAAMAYLSIAGEIAAEQVMLERKGVGSLQIYMLDSLQLMSRDAFMSRLRLVVQSS